MSSKRNQDLTTRERWGTSVDKELLKGFNKIHAKTKIPKSRLLDEAFEYIIEKYKDNN